MKRIGIISDTHSVLNNRVFDLFKGVDLILHAGDIGDEDVLIQLNTIAKTTAVYGNMDDLRIKGKTQKEVTLSIEGLKLHLSHNEKINLKDFDIVVRGHTHVPELGYEGKTLFINPGAANPSQSIPSNKPSVVLLEVKEKEVVNSCILFL